MTLDSIITYSGWVASIISCSFAFYHYYQNRRLRISQKQEIWKQISQMKGTIRGLEESPLSYGGRIKKKLTAEDINKLVLSKEHNSLDYEAITVVEENLLAEFRNLLRIAVSHESNYDLKTINKWYEVGKLSSLWQVRQACHFLETQNINEKDLQDYKSLLDNAEVKLADEINIHFPI